MPIWKARFEDAVARHKMASLLGDMGRSETLIWAGQEKRWHKVVLFCQKIKAELDAKLLAMKIKREEVK